MYFRLQSRCTRILVYTFIRVYTYVSLHHLTDFQKKIHIDIIVFKNESLSSNERPEKSARYLEVLHF